VADQNRLSETYMRTTEDVLLVEYSPTIDTAAYAADDYVGATGAPPSATFARVAGGTGLILGATCVDKDNVKAPFDLYLFDTAIASQTQNAAFAPSDTELLTYVGRIPFTSWQTASGTLNAVSDVRNLNLPFKCVGGSQLLYLALVIRAAGTWTTTTAIKLRLYCERD
jgi:hypothetical protein